MDKVSRRFLILIVTCAILLPALSASGQNLRIAYCLLDRQALELSIKESGISVMNGNGGGVRQLTCWEAAWTSSPSWSPDGKEIAFSSMPDGAGRDGEGDIYVINADGTNVRNLTNTPDFDEMLPSWSPDGKKIVFSGHEVGTGVSGIYVMDMDSRERIELSHDFDMFPAWSPDGSKIVFQSGRGFQGRTDIYVMDADGGNQTNITNALGRNNSYPAWSSDGESVLFSSVLPNENYEISRIHIKSRQMEQLTDSPGVDMLPSCSPDGKKIVFVSNRDASWRGEQYDIYVMDAFGENVVRLTDTPLTEWYPTWSPVPWAVDYAGKMKITWGKVKSD